MLAQSLLKAGGLLSITAYPKHPGGEEECSAVRTLLSSLDRRDWRVFCHQSLNAPTAPVLFNAFKINKFTSHIQ